MRMVDLSHPWDIHTPGWVGYAGNKIYYAQNFQTNKVVAQRIETALHVGTHIDAPMHLSLNPKDIASLPLERLVGEGVIIDISDQVGDWDEIKPEHILAKADVKRGDILIYYTGYARHYTGAIAQDTERYFCLHPGGGKQLADWIIEMELAWTGVDTGTADHPMNTTIRDMRPDLRARYERHIEMPVEQRWPEEELFVMHRRPFMHDIVHVENIGGDVEQVLNRRCRIGAFPWRFVGGEAAMCRVIAFLDE